MDNYEKIKKYFNLIGQITPTEAKLWANKVKQYKLKGLGTAIAAERAAQEVFKGVKLEKRSLPFGNASEAIEDDIETVMQSILNN